MTENSGNVHLLGERIINSAHAYLTDDYHLVIDFVIHFKLKSCYLYHETYTAVNTNKICAYELQ